MSTLPLNNQGVFKLPKSHFEFLYLNKLKTLKEIVASAPEQATHYDFIFGNFINFTSGAPEFALLRSDGYTTKSFKVNSTICDNFVSLIVVKQAITDKETIASVGNFRSFVANFERVSDYHTKFTNSPSLSLISQLNNSDRIIKLIRNFEGDSYANR